MSFSKTRITAILLTLIAIAFIICSIELFIILMKVTAASGLTVGYWGCVATFSGVVIAGIALIGTIYAVVLQAKGGEITSWNIALTRLGEVYDYIQADKGLSKILTELPDEENKDEKTSYDLEIDKQEEVFFRNLFLSFEQIFVASNSLSLKSKEAWGRFLKNQLNKPTIRALFVKDSKDAKDYHQDFYNFVRGIKKSKFRIWIENHISRKRPETGHNEETLRYKNFCIHPKYYDIYTRRKKTLGQA